MLKTVTDSDSILIGTFVWNDRSITDIIYGGKYMPIIYNETMKQFHLSNDKISYIIGIMPNNQMGHLYFGKSIKYREDVSHLFKVTQRALTSYPLKARPDFSLDYVKQEFPSYGTSDYREGCIELLQENGSRISDFKYIDNKIYKGKPRLMDGKLPATYTDEPKDATTLEIILEDKLIETKLRLIYTIFEEEAVITRSAYIVNNGTKGIHLNRALSMCLDFDDADFEMLQLSGSWSRERHVVKRSLVKGIQSIGSIRGASSAAQNPFLALMRNGADENKGEVYGFNFVYSGNFLGQVEVNMDNHARVLMGIHPMHFSWYLEQGEAFQTPEVVMVYSDQGLNGMSQSFHRLYREHLMPKPWNKELAPVLLNNWEATYFNFDEKSIYKIAEQASKLGIDLFVLDDGWFKNRNDDLRALGDWIVDEKKLPNGLPKLSEKIHALGMKFGLWIEPEMTNEDSDLFRAHPEWVVSTPGRSKSYGRHQFVLDFSNSEVVDYIFEMLIKILDATEIDYIKWDMNRNITEPYGYTLEPKRQGEFFHRYILGVYNLYARLRERYPNIMFESCAAGGGRFDPGILFYAPQTWTSDDTDAVERLKIQYGTSLVYPLKSIGSHVAAIPNHQVCRETNLNMRNDVAIFGTYGFELDVNKMDDQEKEYVKEAIKRFKEFQPTIHFGDFYRLISPFETNDYNFVAWMCVDEFKNRAIVALYQILAIPNPGVFKLRLQGLDKDKCYYIKELDLKCYGDELMYIGIYIDQLFTGVGERLQQVFNKVHSGFGEGDFTSCIFTLEVVGE